MDKDKAEEIRRNEAIEKFNASLDKAGLEADPNCKKCYGRRYTGRDIHTNLMKPCRCLRRNKND